MYRQILNLQIPHFCVSLARVKDPALQRRPVAVAELVPRGEVIAFSPEAEKEGIQVGMSTVMARKLCRSLTLIPPDFTLYQHGQSEVLGILNSFTPLVESAAWGSFFLDLTGTRLLWGSGADAAVKVRDRIKGAVGFSPKLGLAVNKLVSEVAEGLVGPLEIYSVFPGEEGRFLSPLPLHCLPRIGNATSRVFEEELGIGTIGLLAGLPAMLLTSVFGKEGMNLSRMARGEDTTAVEPSSQASSLRFSTDLTGGENGRELLEAALFQVCEELGRSLRNRNRLPGRLLLEIDYADGLTVKGLHPAGHPDDDLDLSLFAKSSALFHKLLKRRVRVKRIVLGAPDLRLPLPQLPLFSWDASHDRARALMGAIDQVRKKFGDHALFFGRRCA